MVASDQENYPNFTWKSKFFDPMICLECLQLYGNIDHMIRILPLFLTLLDYMETRQRLKNAFYTSNTIWYILFQNLDYHDKIQMITNNSDMIKQQNGVK